MVYWNKIIEDECCISGCVLPLVSSLHVLTRHYLYFGWSNSLTVVVCIRDESNFMIQRSGSGFK